MFTPECGRPVAAWATACSSCPWFPGDQPGAAPCTTQVGLGTEAPGSSFPGSWTPLTAEHCRRDQAAAGPDPTTSEVTTGPFVEPPGLRCQRELSLPGASREASTAHQSPQLELPGPQSSETGHSHPAGHCPRCPGHGHGGHSSLQNRTGRQVPKQKSRLLRGGLASLPASELSSSRALWPSPAPQPEHHLPLEGGIVHRVALRRERPPSQPGIEPLTSGGGCPPWRLRTELFGV